jgi:hypothetical protein
MAGILEQLELDQPALVTGAELTRLLEAHGVRTPTRVVAARLRKTGWLLPTSRRGVWEFAPAAAAGPYSRNDPVTPLKAFLTQKPAAHCGLSFHAAAWAHNIAERAPARLEVAVAERHLLRQLPNQLATSVFAPKLDYSYTRGVPVLAPESVLVHMTSRPSAVRSWESAREWLPGLAAELSWEPVRVELEGRATAVRARTGYLLSGLRPDLAAHIHIDAPLNKSWFGPRTTLRRHNAPWQIADTILPFDPTQLSASQ